MITETGTRSLVSGLLKWGSLKKNFCLLDSSGYSDHAGLNSFEFISGSGCSDEISAGKNCLNALSVFLEKHRGNWIFGFISYDLKNEIEKLESRNSDRLNFPVIHFFVPEVVLIKKDGTLKISGQSKPGDILSEINSLSNSGFTMPDTFPELLPKISKAEYLEKVRQIKNHIQRGDIYELTCCLEFFSENAEINPAEVYIRLNEFSPAPMSCFYKTDGRYLVSASPERFLKKTGNRLFSQPMKGTIHRSENSAEDKLLKKTLLTSEKERAENVMIVDLVRNDLSKVAAKGSVRVDELFGIYSYRKVHQMVSTVSCELRDEIKFTDIIKATFPMGSMTGAPKVRAMELIEKFENMKRGLFSGCAGYISPEGDFDFNAVIRSLLFNSDEKFLSLSAGGAITAKSDAEMEYAECLLKAESLLNAINTKAILT